MKKNKLGFFQYGQKIEIYGFENELIHVLLNIINNSKDALAEQKICNKQIRIIVKQTDTNVIISIIDNAGGIKSDIMAKVFDPYFNHKTQKCQNRHRALYV